MAWGVGSDRCGPAPEQIGHVDVTPDLAVNLANLRSQVGRQQPSGLRQSFSKVVHSAGRNPRGRTIASFVNTQQVSPHAAPAGRKRAL